MGLEIKIIPRKEHLEVIVSGEFNLQEAVDKISAALFSSRQNPFSKVLIDYRKIKGGILVTEKVIFSYQVRDAYNSYLLKGGKELKFAYVGSPPFVRKFKPGLEIAKKAGQLVAVFTDFKEAISWLKLGKA